MPGETKRFPTSARLIANGQRCSGFTIGVNYHYTRIKYIYIYYTLSTPGAATGGLITIISMMDIIRRVL